MSFNLYLWRPEAGGNEGDKVAAGGDWIVGIASPF
jgi:hypothetical protein